MSITEDEMKAMKLHEEKQLAVGLYVRRVPNGWLYIQWDMSGDKAVCSTFVEEPAKPNHEIKKMERWNAEASEVILRWDEVLKKLNLPTRLGEFKSQQVLDAVNALTSLKEAAFKIHQLYYTHKEVACKSVIAREAFQHLGVCLRDAGYPEGKG